MVVLTDTYRTFNRKVNLIKSQAKKKYYLQKILKDINESIDLTIEVLHIYRKNYIEMKSKYPTATDNETLFRIRYNLHDCLPRQKKFKNHVLTLIAELEHVQNNPLYEKTMKLLEKKIDEALSEDIKTNKEDK